jgi:hypothetical protein
VQVGGLTKYLRDSAGRPRSSPRRRAGAASSSVLGTDDADLTAASSAGSASQRRRAEMRSPLPRRPRAPEIGPRRRPRQAVSPSRTPTAAGSHRRARATARRLSEGGFGDPRPRPASVRGREPGRRPIAPAVGGRPARPLVGGPQLDRTGSGAASTGASVGTFRSASALVVSGRWRRHCAASTGRASPCILNGFDPGEVGLADRLTPDFTLTHTGTFYQGRAIDLLFAALARMLATAAPGPGPGRLFAAEPWVAAGPRARRVVNCSSGRHAARRRPAGETRCCCFCTGVAREGCLHQIFSTWRPAGGALIGGGAGVLSMLVRPAPASVPKQRASTALAAWWQGSQPGASPGRPRRAHRAYSHRRMARGFAALLDRLYERGRAAS